MLSLGEQYALVVVETSPASENVPENQDIYIAFKGVPSLTKSIKSGQKKSDIVVINRQERENVRQLIEKYGIEDLKARVRQLATKGVFTKPSIAQHMFPDLSGDIPAAEAVGKSIAEDKIHGAVNPDELILEPSGDAEAPTGEAIPTEGVLNNAVNLPESDRQPRLERRAQGDRYTARLSLRSQHELMVDLQKYLERACYTYAREHMQDVLEEQCWDCAEAAQLSDWMQQFLSRRSSFDTEANDDELMKLFESGIEICNAAVRRFNMESDEIMELLVDAERLLGVLQVDKYQHLVRNLRVKVEKAANELIREKSQWQDRLEKKLACIAAEEAKLNDMKRAVIVENENSMKESQDVAGSEIRDALDKAEVTFKTEIELDAKHRWTLIQRAYLSKTETDV
ncbi:hypothetical protein HZS61_003242 [Fusarium oxysporum f. sp. conglutinans]|uniref:Uncharacterized protein n=2 Tax=Fusarium oxysporum f. sp. conglutinans TaxID=100902 RepID=A0A8H6LFZ4_FUSOX|nr:hypothetical protein HZS61_003242 [Fusarium oxysporum f. sp. conglutinans]